MAPEKVTDMVLNVDLKCSHCYKKVKKIICKIPQIRDHVFDVGKNTIKIKVVCCSPEKIREKLCYKGGGAIQSIEIIEKFEKLKPVDKPRISGGEKKPSEHTIDLGKAPEPDKGKPKDVKISREVPTRPDPGPNPNVPKIVNLNVPKKVNQNVTKMLYEPSHGYPQMYPTSGYLTVGYMQFYDHVYGGAPFQHGYSMAIAPPQPPPSYGGFGYDDGYNGNQSHYTSNDYGGQENGEGCSIM